MLTEELLEIISKNEPEWLRRQRTNSFRSFIELPLEKSELFKKYVNIDVNFDDFAIQETDANFPKQLSFLLGNDVTYIQPLNELKNSDLLEKGVVFTNIRSAIKNHDTLIRKYFLDSMPENKIVAMNSSFFNSGYFIYIPDNTSLEIPLRVLNVINNEGSLLSKNIIVVGKNSTLKFVEEFYSTQNRSLLNSTTIVHLEEGAQANLGVVQNLGGNVLFFANKKAILDKDARLTSTAGFFGGYATLSRFDSVMQGSGSSSEDYEIVFGSGQQRFDITSNIIHRGMQTNGKVVAKGVFNDSSSGIFKGMINIDKNARYANAYLAEHSMLLGKEAKSDAIPGLEISNNEVKATHSASVAQINDDELFYLMARGLGKEEAKKLIVLGFFDPLFRQIPFSQVKLILKSLFEIKWERLDVAKMQEIMDKIANEDVSEVATTKDIFERHYKYR